MNKIIATHSLLQTKNTDFFIKEWNHKIGPYVVVNENSLYLFFSSLFYYGLVLLPLALPHRRAFLGIGYSSLIDSTGE